MDAVTSSGPLGFNPMAAAKRYVSRASELAKEILQEREPTPIFEEIGTLIPPKPFVATFASDLKLIQASLGSLAKTSPDHDTILRFCYQTIEEARFQTEDYKIEKAKTIVGQAIFLSDKDAKALVQLIDLQNPEATKERINQAFIDALREIREKWEQAEKKASVFAIHDDSGLHCTQKSIEMAKVLIANCGLINQSIVYLVDGVFKSDRVIKGYSWTTLIKDLNNSELLNHAFLSLVINDYTPYPIPQLAKVALGLPCDFPAPAELNAAHSRRLGLAILLTYVSNDQLANWKVEEVKDFLLKAIDQLGYVFRKGWLPGHEPQQISCEDFKFDPALEKKVSINREGKIVYTGEKWNDYPGFKAVLRSLNQTNPAAIQTSLFKDTDEEDVKISPRCLIQMLVEQHFAGKESTRSEHEGMVAWCSIVFSVQANNPFLSFLPALEKYHGNLRDLQMRVRAIAGSILNPSLVVSCDQKPLSELLLKGTEVAKAEISNGSDEQVNLFNFVFANLIPEPLQPAFQDAVSSLSMPMTIQNYAKNLLNFVSILTNPTQDLQEENRLKMTHCLLSKGLSEARLNFLWKSAIPLQSDYYQQEEAPRYFAVYDPILGEALVVSRSKDLKSVEIVDAKLQRQLLEF